MSTQDLDPEMASRMPSEWSFSFWKNRFAQAADFPSKLGLLSVYLDIKFTIEEFDDRMCFLLELSDRDSATEGKQDLALRNKARQVLGRLLYLRRSDELVHLSAPLLEKLLWFFRPTPVDDFTRLRYGWNFVNIFASHESEAEKECQRLRTKLVWALWRREISCATREHRVHALHVFHQTDKLLELIPRERDHHLRWWQIEEMLPELEALALKELKPGHTQSIEELANLGSASAYLVLLARVIRPAAEAFYARHRANRELPLTH